MAKSLLGLFIFYFSFSANALIPAYQKPQILARANGPDSYELPSMSYLNSTSPFINNNGQVAFKLMAVEGQNTQALWVNGQVVFRAEEGKVLTDPSMNDRGQVITSVYDEGSSDGIYVYDSANGLTKNVVPNQNTDIIAHSYSQILDNGEIYFRATHVSQDHTFFHFTNGLVPVFSEGDGSLGFKASYLFGPVMNNQGEIATKIRVGNLQDWGNNFPDQILLVNPHGGFRIVAEDQKSNPKSPYVAFNNAVSLSESGLVAFVATLTNGKKSVIVDDQGIQSTYATEGENGIQEIELFTVKVNSHGLTVFRAIDKKNLRAIYLADGHEVRRVIGEKDEIPTDLGMARILFNPNVPGFGGNVALNDRNEIAFYVLINKSVGGEDWGSAVYKLSPMF